MYEMLRKKGKATQHNRKKQHNTTRPYFSKKKLPRVGFEPMTVRLLGLRSYMYQLCMYTVLEVARQLTCMKCTCCTCNY